MNKLDFEPTSELCYFAINENGEALFFKTEKESIDYANKYLESLKDTAIYLESGWPNETQHIATGVVTRIATKTDVVNRPSDLGLNDDMEDCAGNYWGGDYEYRCNYELQLITKGE